MDPPTSTEDEDFISFSASLFDILCYVDKEDIPNCKLVNRQINNVVRRNAKSFPLVKSRMTLTFLKCTQQGNTVIVTIEVEGNDRWSCVVSENEPIYVRIYPGQMMNDLLEVYIATRNENQLTLHTNRCIDDLRNILEIILRCYYFEKVKMVNLDADSEVQEGFFAAFGNAFEASRSKCKTMHMNEICLSGLGNIRTELECLELWHLKADALQKELFSILQVRAGHVFIRTAASGGSSLELINGIIKNWESGDVRFKSLHVSSCDRQSKAKETCDSVLTTPWFNVTYATEEDGKCKMQFRRQMDEKALCLSYDVESGVRGFNRDIYQFNEL